MPSMEWTGTWLQAVWLVRQAQLVEWHSLLELWSRSSVLDRGTALLVAVPPAAVTHRSLEDPEYLPELRWTDDRQIVLDALRHHFPRRIELALRGGSDITELRIDTIVNDDDSLSLYLSVPLNLFEVVDQSVGRRRFREFLAICTELFDPKMVLAGTLGEEAQLHGLDALKRDIDRWTGRAFYGEELATELAKLEHLMPELGVKQPLNQGGLFISWAEWPEWREAPAAWRRSVLSVLNAKGI